MSKETDRQGTTFFIPIVTVASHFSNNLRFQQYRVPYWLYLLSHILGEGFVSQKHMFRSPRPSKTLNITCTASGLLLLIALAFSFYSRRTARNFECQPLFTLTSTCAFHQLHQPRLDIQLTSYNLASYCTSYLLTFNKVVVIDHPWSIKLTKSKNKTLML